MAENFYNWKIHYFKILWNGQLNLDNTYFNSEHDFLKQPFNRQYIHHIEM